MIQVEVKSRVEAEVFIMENYEEASERIIQVEARELIDYFREENKDEWFIITYRGKLRDVAMYMSFLTYRVFKRFFVEITVSEDGNLTQMQELLGAITESNTYEDAPGIIALKTDSSLKSGEVGFVLISPRYTYSDMWKAE